MASRSVKTASRRTNETRAKPSTKMVAETPPVGANGRVTGNRETVVRRHYARQKRSAYYSSTSLFTAGRTFYEAASYSQRIEHAVESGPNGANTEIERVRIRSRWTYANDSMYRQGIRNVANNVVHYGIKPTIPWSDLRELWDDWVEEADSRGRLDFYGMQWLAVMCTARDGEALFRFRQRRDGDMDSGIDFQIQMLEADHMPLDKTEQVEGGHWIVSGVERDGIDRPVAYWLYDHHPKDWRSKGGGNLLPKRVPAEDVIHMYMPERIGDTRGYPWAASALNIVESLRTYDEAELERKKGQSMFGVFYTRPDTAPKIDQGDVPGDSEGAVVEEIEFQPMEPNTATEVPFGYDVKFPQMPPTDSNYGMYRRENLSGLAVALGQAVEQITLNFEKVNDRQARFMALETGRYIESLQHHMVVRQLCQRTWRRFVSEAIRKKLWTPPAGTKRRDYMRPEWIAPARGHIHPLQEIAAFVEAVRNGFMTREDVTAAFGYNVADVDAKNARNQAAAKEMGLVYPVYAAIDGTAPPLTITETMKVIAEIEAAETMDAMSKHGITADMA